MQNSKNNVSSLKNGKRKMSLVISLGGIISALCLLMMFFTAVFPSFSLAIPIFAGMLITIMAIEFSSSWAFITYATVSLLSFFITPSKESAIFFFLFFGYYPILKYILERFKSKLLTIVTKLVVFNIAIILIYYIVVRIFMIVDLLDEFSMLGSYIIPALLIFFNLTFLLYDKTLGTIVILYKKYFKPVFLPNFK